MLTIIFFIALFAGCALYYLNFLVRYCRRLHKDAQRLHQTVTVYKIPVNPVVRKAEFIIPEDELKYYATNTYNGDYARKQAARLIADDVYELVLQDRNRQLFDFNERKKQFDPQYYGRVNHYSIEIQILPPLKY